MLRGILCTYEVFYLYIYVSFLNSVGVLIFMNYKYYGDIFFVGENINIRHRTTQQLMPG